MDGALFRGKTRTTSHSEDHGLMEHGGTGSFGEDGGGACFFDGFSLNGLSLPIHYRYSNVSFKQKTESNSVRDKINIHPETRFVKQNHNESSRFFKKNMTFP